MYNVFYGMKMFLPTLEGDNCIVFNINLSCGIWLERSTHQKNYGQLEKFSTTYLAEMAARQS